MILDAERVHARRQAFAIGLALIPHKVGMGSAQNDIDGIRAGFDDSGHGIDHCLDTLARRQETERQNDGLSSKAAFRFGVMRFEERKVGYSVRYDLDLASRHV